MNGYSDIQLFNLFITINLSIMKNIIVKIFSLSIICLFTLSVQAQNAKSSNKKIATEEFTVAGVCGMCEKRIEKAALVPGVMSAAWDQDAQSLKVMYKRKKVDLKDIKTAVAAIGHDTDTVKGDDEAYAELPGCCKFRDGVESH